MSRVHDDTAVARAARVAYQASDPERGRLWLELPLAVRVSLGYTAPERGPLTGVEEAAVRQTAAEVLADIAVYCKTLGISAEALLMAVGKALAARNYGEATP